MLALGKTPFNLLRGSGGEEKVLKNAKDACRVGGPGDRHLHGDRAPGRAPSATTRRPSSPRRSAPTRRRCSSASCARSPSSPTPSSAPRSRATPPSTSTKTGAADAVREAGEAAKDTARTTAAKAKRTSRQARKVPGVAQAEGQIKGAVASEGDLAIARYDKLTAEEIIGRLAELSQIDLAKIDSYERKNQNRATVLSRITTLRGDEPWAGYDELTAAEVQAVLSEGDDDRVARSAPTSAATRTAPASSRPPSASSRTPSESGWGLRHSGGPDPGVVGQFGRRSTPAG